MCITQRWFDKIVSGDKPIEGRKKSPKWEKIKVNQILNIKCDETGEIRKFLVTHIVEYDNLKQYLICEGIDRCLPGVRTIEEGIEIYKQWSTEQELQKYKFLAIGLKVIN